MLPGFTLTEKDKDKAILSLHNCTKEDMANMTNCS
jgi:hypothetical protein